MPTTTATNPEPDGVALPETRAAGDQAVLAELGARKAEALRLYEPLLEQEAFHRSLCRVRLYRGSNRAGKTVCTVAEAARALTGTDPWNKYPKTDGRCFIVGKNLDHVGQVLWRKLGRPGAIKMIRDTSTGKWRSYRPWDPADLARASEAKAAPPFLPPRLITSIAWENKAKGIPKTVKLTNGWELNFYSSEAKPPQGADVDLVVFDEEIVDESWLAEMRFRILDRKGRLIWSATPQAGTEQLFKLHEIAVQDAAKPPEERQVEEFVALLVDNPHIDAEEKRAIIGDESLSEDEYRVRIEGEFLFTSFKVYPNFNMTKHGVDWFEIPPEWTRYLVVDPGYQVCAVLFAAVPPPHPHLGDEVYLYDELYLRDCTPTMLAEQVRHKTLGHTFQAFLIDRHGSVRTEPGVSKSLLEMYTEAFTAHGIKSRATGHSFAFASDDVQAGIMAVQAWLRDRPEKGPKLRVLRGVLKHFEREIKYYHYRREGNTVSDKPYQRRNHLMDTLRYAALYNPVYVKPGLFRRTLAPALAAFRALQQKDRDKQGTPYVRLGPGSP